MAVWIILGVCFVKMDKLQYRTVIEFFVLDGLSAIETYSNVINIGKKWATEFRHGLTSFEDETSEERLKATTTIIISRRWTMWVH